jgi:hypothetical protein
MDRGRVGEDRGSKETDGCPLTVRYCQDRQIHMGKQMPSNMETPTACTQTDKKKHLRQTYASANQTHTHRRIL